MEKIFIQIERYLEGEMSDSEKVSFEAKLKKDTWVQKELKQHQQIHKAIQTYRDELLKQRLKQSTLDMMQVAPESSFWKWLIPVATIVLVGLVSSPWWMPYIEIEERIDPIPEATEPIKEPSQEQEKVDTIIPPDTLRNMPKKVKQDNKQIKEGFGPKKRTPIDTIKKSIAAANQTNLNAPIAALLESINPPNYTQLNAGEDEWKQGQRLLQEKQYQAANEVFQVLRDSLSEESMRFYEVQVLSGYCLLMLKEFDAAINIFDNIPRGATDPYKDAKWYLALSHIQKQQIEEAKKILSNIANNKRNSYQAKAKEALSLIR